MFNGRNKTGSVVYRKCSPSISYVVSICVLFVATCEGGLTLTVSNNGPAMHGCNITFEAELHGPFPNLVYNWTWEDDANPKTHVVQFSKTKATFSKAYFGEGHFTMSVSVSFFFKWASAKSEFTILKNIPGEILVRQFGQLKTPKSYLTSENETEFEAKISDPAGCFNNATSIDYMWSIDSIPLYADDKSKMTYLFDLAGNYKILVSVTVITGTTLDFYDGSFMTQVKIRDPIKQINVTGNTILNRGDIVDLDVNCDGSSPWNYCWMPVSDATTALQNISCTETMTTNDCEFRIIYYFAKAGHYKMLINISNDINEQVSITDISLYNVLPEPQLSVVIIPVVCILLAVGIIFAGCVLFYQTRKQFTIEEADFDFTGSERYTYHTFCEQLKDAISKSMPSTGIFERDWNFMDCCKESDAPKPGCSNSDDVDSTLSLSSSCS